MDKKKYTYLLILILLAGLAVRLFELNEPWIGLKDFTGALHGQIAKNYLRFGYLGTGFGPVTNFELHPESYSYYFHHPVLFNILLSLPMHLLGTDEWVLRLVPTMASTAGIVLVFYLVQLLWGTSTALTAALFLAFVPMDGFFGRMVNEETVAAPIMTALLILYVKRSGAGKPAMGPVFFTLLIFGLFTAWPLYYFAGFLFIHCLMNARKRGIRLRECLLLPATAALSFAIFLLHSRYLTGKWGQSLFRIFLERTGAYSALMRRGSLSSVLESRFIYFFTPVLLLLSLAYLLQMVSKRKQNPPGGVTILLLLYLVAISHVLLFREGALHHEYWLYYFSVPLVISSALGLDYIITLIRKDSVKTFVYSLVCVTFISLSLWRIVSLHAVKKFEYVPELGEWLQKNTGEQEEILVIGPSLATFGYSETHFDYHPGRIYTWPMPHLGYYSQRKMRWGIRDIDELTSILRESGNLRYAVMTEEHMDSLAKSAYELLSSHREEVVPEIWRNNKSIPVRIFELRPEEADKPKHQRG